MMDIDTYLEVYIQVALMGFAIGSVIELLMFGIVRAVRLLDIQK